MLIQKRTFVALSFAASVTLAAVLTGCMKMHNMTSSSVIIEKGGFDTPLSIPSILSAQNLSLEAKMTSAFFLNSKTTSNALLYNGSIPLIKTYNIISNMKMMA